MGGKSARSLMKEEGKPGRIRAKKEEAAAGASWGQAGICSKGVGSGGGPNSEANGEDKRDVSSRL